MFRVALHRTFQFLLFSVLGLAASSAVAQDPAKDPAKDQPKDEVQAQQDQKATDAAAKGTTSAQAQQPADAVDPLKRPLNDKNRKKNEQVL
jgi:hypothetical protein